MRIAIVTEVFPPKVDGITNRLSHTVRHLGRMGHEVLVIAPEGSVAEHEGARVVAVPGLPFPPYPGLKICAPDPRIALELRSFQPQVVHAVGPACLGLWGIAAARMLDLPLVASYHTDFPRYLPLHGMGFLQPAAWPLIRWVHNAAHVNLCPSRFTREELRDAGVQNVDLWRGGVDTELFHPERRSLEMRMRMTGGRPDGPVVLYVGRLSPEKNLETFESILDENPDARVALAGDGPARAELEERFAGRPVRFLGFLRGEELAAAFASADCFLMPSTTETLGFVVLEAMSSGCPVVGARAGGIPDLIRHGENGLFYDPEVPGAAAQAVGEVLSRDILRQHLAVQARKFAEAGSWEQETRALVHQYRKAMVLHARSGLLGRVRRALFAT